MPTLEERLETFTKEHPVRFHIRRATERVARKALRDQINAAGMTFSLLYAPPVHLPHGQAEGAGRDNLSQKPTSQLTPPVDASTTAGGGSNPKVGILFDALQDCRTCATIGHPRIQMTKRGTAIMDGVKFDSLTRALATAGSSRRKFIRGAFGLVGGVALQREAVAAIQGCMDSSVCGGRCDTAIAADGTCTCYGYTHRACLADPCESQADCSDGFICVQTSCENPRVCLPVCPTWGGSSSCPDGQELCAGSCVDTTSNPLSCGSCGNTCGGGEIPPWNRWGCIAGECTLVCASDADYCREECTYFEVDSGNCGGCDNHCGDSLCCGGRCVTRDSAERFCDFCGMFPGWPQGCNADEVCNGGLCVSANATGGAAGTRTYWLGSWTCTDIPPKGIEPPFDVVGTNTPSVWDLPNCTKDNGATYSLLNGAGEEIARCTTVNGLCQAEVPVSRIEGTGTYDPETKIVEAVALDLPEGTTRQDDSAVTPELAVIFNWPAAGGDVQLAPGELPTKGNLAYAIRSDGHWSIWTYDFATDQSTELANEPGSDQFAPSYSHDGASIAYLSDQVGLVNQVWLMDVDGGNKKQLTNYTGTGQLVHLAWGYDDGVILATETGGEFNHMLAVAPTSGDISSYWDEWGGWPSFAANDMVFIGQTEFGAPWPRMERNRSGELDSNIMAPDAWGNPFLFGNPDLSAATGMLALEIGAQGERSVIAYVPNTDRDVPPIPKVGSDNGDPAFSPDGTWLAFVAINGTDQQVVVLELFTDTTSAAIELPPHDRVWYLTWR